MEERRKTEDNAGEGLFQVTISMVRRKVLFKPDSKAQNKQKVLQNGILYKLMNGFFQNPEFQKQAQGDQKIHFVISGFAVSLTKGNSFWLFKRESKHLMISPSYMPLLVPSLTRTPLSLMPDHDLRS